MNRYRLLHISSEMVKRARKLKGCGVLDDLKKGFENFVKSPVANSNDLKDYGERIKKSFGGGKNADRNKAMMNRLMTAQDTVKPKARKPYKEYGYKAHRERAYTY